MNTLRSTAILIQSQSSNIEVHFTQNRENTQRQKQKQDVKWFFVVYFLFE